MPQYRITEEPAPSSDRVAGLLRRLPLSNTQRADLWDAYESSAGVDQLTTVLERMNVPRWVKAELWDLKAGGTPAPTQASPETPARTWGNTARDVARRGDQRTLAQRVRAKYPGAYDDMDDAALEAAVVAKYPGVYDDIPRTGQPQAPAGRLRVPLAALTVVENPPNDGPRRRELSEQEFNAIRERVLDALPDGLTEAEFNRLAGPALEAALAEAEYSPITPEGSAAGRFLRNAGEVLNPVSLVKGLYGAATNPIETLRGIGADMRGQAQQAWQAAKEGRVAGVIGHGVGITPLIGPAAVQAGEQIASGDVAGGLGRAAGLLLPAAAPTVARAARQAVPTGGRAGVAQRLEAGASSRVSDVMRPTVGANKTRFANMADDVAPALVRRGEVGGWSREGLANRVSSRLAEAEHALDAASDARLSARTFPTGPILSDLMAKRRALMAEAVEGSQHPRTVNPPSGPTRAQQLEGLTGEVPAASVGTVKPIGKDVVPGPNAARVAVIDEAIDELRQLGSVARYEPLRVIRQAYDGPARAVYNPSMTSDFLKAQGGKLGAADVTSVLRERLAQLDPRTAAANADYSLYRKANDVLEAAAEVERTRPRVGRQIIARLTGATVGGQTAGAGGAVAGFVLGPVLEAAMGAGGTTKLQTARLMGRLAEAVRRGDVGHVASLTTQLKRLGAQAATLHGAAEASGQRQAVGMR